MREEKGRRRGNKAVWPHMYSCLIQTKKENIENRQTVQTANNSAVTNNSFIITFILWYHLS